MKTKDPKVQGDLFYALFFQDSMSFFKSFIVLHILLIALLMAAELVKQQQAKQFYGAQFLHFLSPSLFIQT